jgi:cell division protein YceG involved in septum cleavage
MPLFYNKTTAKSVFERALIIAAFSLLLSALLLSVINDVYAFVKPDGELKLTFTEPMPLSELSRLLQKEGVVKNPTVFSLFVRSKSKADELESFVGEATLRMDMSYREIILALS